MASVERRARPGRRRVGSAALCHETVGVEHRPGDGRIARREQRCVALRRRLGLEKPHASHARRIQLPPWPLGGGLSIQCESALSELLHESRPADAPLFEHFLPQMLQDGFANQLQNSARPADEMWELLRSESPWSRKGSKCMRSRFLAFFREARHESKFWAARAFGYIYVCIEIGSMAKVELQPLKFSKAKKQDDPAMATTSARRETEEEQAMRASSQNNMVLSALVFSSQENASKLRLVLELTEALETWHSIQNRELRSCGGSEAWLLA